MVLKNSARALYASRVKSILHSELNADQEARSLDLTPPPVLKDFSAYIVSFEFDEKIPTI